MHNPYSAENDDELTGDRGWRVKQCDCEDCRERRELMAGADHLFGLEWIGLEVTPGGKHRDVYSTSGLFWKAWNLNKSKMRRLGYSATKTADGDWYALHYCGRIEDHGGPEKWREKAQAMETRAISHLESNQPDSPATAVPEGGAEANRRKLRVVDGGEDATGTDGPLY